MDWPVSGRSKFVSRIVSCLPSDQECPERSWYMAGVQQAPVLLPPLSPWESHALTQQTFIEHFCAAITGHRRALGRTHHCNHHSAQNRILYIIIFRETLFFLIRPCFLLPKLLQHRIWKLWRTWASIARHRDKQGLEHIWNNFLGDETAKISALVFLLLLLEHNYFTMLCWFLLYKEVNHYTYTSIPSFLDLPPTSTPILQL